MNKGTIIILLATALILALGIGLSLAREIEPQDVEQSKIARSLEEVLSNQAKILEELKAIKQELGVIKVRASRR